MNIKSLTANISPLDRTKPTERTSEKDTVRMENSSKDRDANGQRQGQQEHHKEHLNDEEMREALETIRGFKGVQEHNLEVELVQSGEKRVILIKDLQGNVIRRIPEAELWPILNESFKTKGQILDKAG